MAEGRRTLCVIMLCNKRIKQKLCRLLSKTVSHAHVINKAKSIILTTTVQENIPKPLFLEWREFTRSKRHKELLDAAFSIHGLIAFLREGLTLGLTVTQTKSFPEKAFFARLQLRGFSRT